MLKVDHAAQPEASALGFLRRMGILFLKDWRFSAYTLLLAALLLIICSSLGRGDDLTGQPQDDPKDLMPAPSQSTSSHVSDSGMFVPMPSWARNIIMPPLPVELKPMGGKTKVAGPTPPTPQPLTPPKDATVTVSTPTTPKPADNNAAMIAVSPFLQWVKTNPQAAAAQAHEQSEVYHAGPTPAANAPANGAPNNPAGSNAQDPYWLPPLIDSPGFGPTAVPVTGSAAIYSTPQR